MIFIPKPNLKDLLKGKTKTSKESKSSEVRGQNSDIDPREPSRNPYTGGATGGQNSDIDPREPSRNPYTGGATGGQPSRNPYTGGATGGQPSRNPYTGGATGGQPSRNPYTGGATGGQPSRNPYIGGATGGQPSRNPYTGGATGGQPSRNPYTGGATGGILKSNSSCNKLDKPKKVHFNCSDKDFDDLEKQKQKNKQELKDMALASLTQLSDITRQTGGKVPEEEVLRHTKVLSYISDKKEEFKEIYDTVFGNTSYPPPIEVDDTPYPKYPLDDRASLLENTSLRLTGNKGHYLQQMKSMVAMVMESGLSEAESKLILSDDPSYSKLENAYNDSVEKLSKLPYR